MKTQALVLSDDPVYLSWLRAALPGWEFSQVRVQDADDLPARAQGLTRADLLIVHFDRASLAARTTLLERTLARLPELPVAGIGDEDDPALMLAAMRAGARDFLLLKRDESQAAALLGRLLRQNGGSAQPARRQGRLLAVLGPTPDASLAFVGEHLALACAERLGAGERTLLLDLAMPAGAGAVFLDLKPGYGVLDALQDTHRFDATLIDTTFARHASGTYVLSLPEDLIGVPRLDESDLLGLLEGVRSHFACTVVVADAQTSYAAVRAAAAQSDRAALLTEQSVLRSRHCKHLLHALRAEDCALDRLGLVVDQYTRRVGLEPDNLAQLFELPLLGALSTQSANRVQAMNSGQPLFDSAPRDETCAGVRALASAMLGLPAAKAAPAAGGLLGRLFS